MVGWSDLFYPELGEGFLLPSRQSANAISLNPSLLLDYLHRNKKPPCGGVFFESIDNGRDPSLCSGLQTKK
jgi:hypothetical protein